MSLPQATPVPVAQPVLASAPQALPEARWGLPLRLAFRFAFAYLVLYCVPFPLWQLPVLDALAERYHGLWEALVPWVGKHLLRLETDIVLLPTGSGDTLFNYVQVLVYAVLAAVAAGIWSGADRRRLEYTQLHAELRVYVRYFLAAAMLSYGLAKVFKTQFPAPSLLRLTQTYGESSPMGLVWSFMGHSTGYNVFTGGAEVLGAVLLCFRRTTTLGALVVVAVMSNVAALNFFYDVPVKLFSSHLLLMAGFLLLPDLRRLADFLVLNRATAPRVLRTPFSAPWMERGSRVVKVLFLGWCVFSDTRSKLEAREQWGDGAPKPALYGIYTVESFAWDGVEVPPLATDATRWRMVVFGEGHQARLRMMDDSARLYRVMDRPEEQTLTLSPREDAVAPMFFSYSRPDAESLVLEGTFGDRTLRILLGRVDASKLLLVNRGFHWVNETAFNR